MTSRRMVAAIGMLMVWASSVCAQTVTQRGFVDGRAFLFPQDALNDTTTLVADFLVRDEVFVKAAPWIQFAGGLDLRASSHDQVEDEWRLDFSARSTRRARLSGRRP